MADYIFQSARLGFRKWRDSDLPIFTEINSDPLVMEHFPGTLSAQQTKALIQRIQDHFIKHGYGLYAVDRYDLAEFIGFIGFQHVRFESYFTPAIEIGYRLHHDHWGNGFATEGTVACFNYAFGVLKIPEIVSFTAILNSRSERVMQKTGMTKVGEFLHPGLPESSPLRRHVLYKIRNTD